MAQREAETVAAVIAQPVQEFLAEWLSSTVQVLFSPSSISGGSDDGAASLRDPVKNLAFAASSIGIAFLIFQVDAEGFDLTHQAPTAVLYVGIWCLYALVPAMLLKLLHGSQTAITNVLVGIRLLAIFYVFSMIAASLAFLASGKQPMVFYGVFLSIEFLLSVIYFPAVFCKLNGLKRVGVIVFVICIVPFSLARAIIAERFAPPALWSELMVPLPMAPPPMAPPPMAAPPMAPPPMAVPPMAPPPMAAPPMAPPPMAPPHLTAPPIK